MATGTGIICSSNPKGVFLEGTISGSSIYPGTVMMLKPATDPIGGRPVWEVYQPGSDGQRHLMAVLLADEEQGKTALDAYTDGTRCFLYVPHAGEELNMLLSKAGTSTGDHVAIGDVFIVKSGTGLLVATTGSPQSEPFQATEKVVFPDDITSTGTLTRCMFTGY